MSTGPSPSDSRSVLALEPQRRLSVEDYHRMIEAGVFGEDERLELLEGVIVEMSPQKPRHAEVISRLGDARFLGSAPNVTLRVQLPLTLGPDSEPEPDVAIVHRTPGGYRDAHPTAALLVFEVSGESLRKDRVAKAAVYARCGIPEYVIVNLAEDCLEVRRDPDPAASQYRSTLVLRADDRFESVAVPGLAFGVNDLLS
jgi:Uma2 family endonuclease